MAGRAVGRHAPDARRTIGVAVRRIGNPVAWRDANGRLHLYVVGTGLGGWAASRVVHLQADGPNDTASVNGLRLQAQRVLPLMPLTPWFNTSTLVRALPQPLQDGRGCPRILNWAPNTPWPFGSGRKDNCARCVA